MVLLFISNYQVGCLIHKCLWNERRSEGGGFCSSVSCTGWHLAKVSNENAHTGEPVSLPESMEDSGRVGEAPRYTGFVLMQLAGLQNLGG